MYNYILLKSWSVNDFKRGCDFGLFMQDPQILKPPNLSTYVYTL